MLQQQSAHFRPGKPSSWIVILWILMIVLKLWLITIGEVFWVDICSKASVVVGMLVIWHHTPVLISKLKISSSTITQTFFIYLAHEPLLTLVKKGLLATIANANLTFTYFLSVAIVLASVSFLGIALKTLVPRFYSKSTGGR